MDRIHSFPGGLLIQVFGDRTACTYAIYNGPPKRISRKSAADLMRAMRRKLQEIQSSR